MNPVTKTLLILLGSIFSMFMVPAILILLRDYLLAILCIMLFVSCFGLFTYYAYIECYQIILAKQLEEEEIFLSFQGDPEKIRFYKGFKKYFDGEINAEGLQKWLENHPLKH